MAKEMVVTVSTNMVGSDQEVGLGYDEVEWGELNDETKEDVINDAVWTVIEVSEPHTGRR